MNNYYTYFLPKKLILYFPPPQISSCSKVRIYNSVIGHDTETASSNTLSPQPPNLNHYKGKGKGKAVPLQAWSGPEGSRKLRFPDFMTAAQDGGKVVSLTHRPPLPPENAPGTHFC